LDVTVSAPPHFLNMALLNVHLYLFFFSSYYMYVHFFQITFIFLWNSIQSKWFFAPGFERSSVLPFFFRSSAFQSCVLVFSLCAAVIWRPTTLFGCCLHSVYGAVQSLFLFWLQWLFSFRIDMLLKIHKVHWNLTKLGIIPLKSCHKNFDSKKSFTKNILKSHKVNIIS
jgi:hypothetical protein